MTRPVPGWLTTQVVLQSSMGAIGEGSTAQAVGLRKLAMVCTAYVVPQQDGCKILRPACNG